MVLQSMIKPAYLRESIETVAETPRILRELTLRAAMELDDLRLKDPHRIVPSPTTRYAQALGVQIDTVQEDTEKYLSLNYTAEIIYPIFRAILYSPGNNLVEQNKDTELLKECFRNGGFDCSPLIDSDLDTTSERKFVRTYILPSIVRLEELLSNMGEHPEHYTEQQLLPAIGILGKLSREYEVISVSGHNIKRY